MYQLAFSKRFEKQYIEIKYRDAGLEKKIRKALFFLCEDPHYPSLRTHKVDAREFPDVWSSWVTGDIRIIWEYSQHILSITVIEIGSHSGGNKVYK